MAILFDWYENPNASLEEEKEEKGLHPRIFLNGKVETNELCDMIHARSSLTVGDVKSALDTLSELFGEQLRAGRAIHLQGIGYFYPTLTTTQKVTRSTRNKTKKLALKTIRFRPDVQLKGALVDTHAHRSKQAWHSEKLSEVEIDMRLKEYFAEHRAMIRSDFQKICGMARTTAKTQIVRLRKEGKLLNLGTRVQPFYVPAPGYYGVSRDAEQRW